MKQENYLHFTHKLYSADLLEHISHQNMSIQFQFALQQRYFGYLWKVPCDFFLSIRLF